MSKLRAMRSAICVAMLCAAFSVPAMGQELSRPLADITIGSLFPNVVDKAAEGTAQSWQQSADVLVSGAKERQQLVSAAVKAKNGELDQLKTQLKAAKKDKDFAKSGALEGQIKSQEIVVGVLKQLEKVSKQQLDLAESWQAVAKDLTSFVDTNKTLDTYRSAGIVRPAEGETDRRLDPAGYEAFTKHTDALITLGKAFSKFGSDIGNLGGQRKEFLKSLEKGGHVRTTK